MEIFLLISSGLVGLLVTFSLAVFSSMSLDKFTFLVELRTDSSKSLLRLRNNQDETVNSFIIIETFFYAVSFITAGLYIFSVFNNWIYVVYTTLILFASIVLVRTVFYAIGRRYSDIISIKMSFLLAFFAVVLYPLITLIKGVNNLVGVQSDEASREELTALFETAREGGSIEADEYRILKNIMHFSEVIVSDVMTPRTVVFSLQADKTVAEIVNLPELRMYSRIPVWEGESLDDGVVGYVMAKDIYSAALSGSSDIELRKLGREVYFIPENAELDHALDRFIKRRQHLFMVVDEYGGIEGLLTMEDVLETILGVEIVDEADKIVDLRSVAKHLRDKRIASMNVKAESN
ncbi:MAG: CNNM domain-containing protein [Bacteroidota bacterium]